MKNVVITGADRNIGLELARQFLERGWRVFAGRYLTELTYLDELKAEYPDQLHIIMLDVSTEETVAAAAAEVQAITPVVDMMVHNAAGFGAHGDNDIKGKMDFTGYLGAYNINALGAMRLVQGFLPLMQEGMKRFCFVSSEAGVISVAHRDGLTSYGMSKTALNMALRLMFEKLQPMGYSFRVYHPGWVRSAKDGRTRDPNVGKYDPWETAASAVPQFIEDREWEDRLMMLDVEDRAWSF